MELHAGGLIVTSTMKAESEFLYYYKYPRTLNYSSTYIIFTNLLYKKNFYIRYIMRDWDVKSLAAFNISRNCPLTKTEGTQLLNQQFTYHKKKAQLQIFMLNFYILTAHILTAIVSPSPISGIIAVVNIKVFMIL